MNVDLSTYNNDWYKPGNVFKRFCWYWINIIFFKSSVFPIYRLKVFWLKTFGATVGKNVLIKPCVNIKYPWFLSIGKNVWIGEQVWIDNLALVSIGDNVCISQGALLLCGNHCYDKPGFDLMVNPIKIEEGVWLGAQSSVFGGAICARYSVLSAGTFLSNRTEAYGIYEGNPAKKIKERIIRG